MAARVTKVILESAKQVTSTTEAFSGLANIRDYSSGSVSVNVTTVAAAGTLTVTLYQSNSVLDQATPANMVWYPVLKKADLTSSTFSLTAVSKNESGSLDLTQQWFRIGYKVTAAGDITFSAELNLKAAI